MSELCSWAKHVFELNKADKTGTTKREHLEQVQKQTSKAVAELKPPTDFPYVISHIWSYFLELGRSRSMGFSGPNPITYQEIKCWQELTETTLRPWEIAAIKKLDEIYLGASYDK